MTDFRELLPPIRDQGERETCLSMALSDGHHCARSTDPALAPEFLHFTATRIAQLDVNGGVPSSAAIRALEEVGQPSEGDCPYSPANREPAWKPPAPTALWRHRTAKSTKSAVAAVSEHLDAGKPAVVVMAIDDAFFAPVAGVVETTAGKQRGSHAVLAIASNAGRILVRNSWGSEWGADGYAWLSTAYVTARCTAVITFEGAIT
jgi:hypothetical protein